MICRMTEWQFYDKKDKHQIAYTQLACDRSRRMIELLGYKDKDGTTVDACLRCHAVPEVGRNRMRAGFLSEGVTCVACHGAYREWVDEHPSAVLLLGLPKQADRPKDAPKDWLELNRIEKENLKGMTDLWDPVRRTEICASCHVGSFKEKKIITHAMYAAGHPPLPSFEPATFGELQPRHWQTLREKKAKQRQRLQPFNPSNLEHAELVAISGPVVLRESMSLFADQANVNRDDPPGAAWPDFARYDCRACHHELRSEAHGLPRGGGTSLGRPGEPSWLHTLVRLGIQVLSADAATAAAEQVHYDSLVKAFRAALSTQPFGDRVASIQAATDLASWADGLLKDRSKTGVNVKRAWQLLDEICAAVETTSVDYDAARQLAWGFRAIYCDAVLDDQPAARDPAIKLALDQLDNALFMGLRSANEQVPIERSLENRLRSAADYNPAAVRKLFSRLRALVAGH